MAARKKATKSSTKRAKRPDKKPKVAFPNKTGAKKAAKHPKGPKLDKIFKEKSKEDHRSRIVTSMDDGFDSLTQHGRELGLFCQVGKVTKNLESRVSALEDVLRCAKALVEKANAIGKELRAAGVDKLIG